LWEGGRDLDDYLKEPIDRRKKKKDGTSTTCKGKVEKNNQPGQNEVSGPGRGKSKR